ncbi:MAG: hypothetical protein AAFV98_14545 [Chloroflexota bacterium]
MSDDSKPTLQDFPDFVLHSLHDSKASLLALKSWADLLEMYIYSNGTLPDDEREKFMQAITAIHDKSHRLSQTLDTMVGHAYDLTQET